jgi:hypothetical protein
LRWGPGKWIRRCQRISKQWTKFAVLIRMGVRYGMCTVRRRERLGCRYKHYIVQINVSTKRQEENKVCISIKATKKGLTSDVGEGGPWCEVLYIGIPPQRRLFIGGQRWLHGMWDGTSHLDLIKVCHCPINVPFIPLQTVQGKLDVEVGSGHDFQDKGSLRFRLEREASDRTTILVTNGAHTIMLSFDCWSEGNDSKRSWLGFCGG